VSIAIPYAPGERFHFLPALHSEPSSPLLLNRQHFHPFQLITHLFQHAGLLHLLGNMLFLFVFGNAVNAKLGHPGYLAAYFAIGLIAGVVWLAIGHGSACLGASGAIMGVCGLFMVFYPRNDVTIFWDDFPISWLTSTWTNDLPGWAVALLFLAFDVWGEIFHRDSGVAYISHIAGALMGLALGISLLKSGLLSPDRGEQNLLMLLAGESPAGEPAD
jgi:membrane associated rhomboid family serine protease